MHVRTETVITGVEVVARLQAAAETDAVRPEGARRLECEGERVPPKLFLRGLPVTMPAAAEVITDEKPGATEVVLRLMWGPLPAPFPRALAGVGALAAVAVLLLSDRSVADWLVALLAVVLPVAALLYQRTGERLLQERVNTVLAGTGFVPRPH